MDSRVQLFGIRHHGPGCAASLEQALHKLMPARVLIEGPPEANALIPLASAAGMRPPIAILTYPTSTPEEARFYPFAEYSPEWRAMQWALANNRPVAFIDSPALVNEIKDESEEHIDDKIDDKADGNDDEELEAEPPEESEGERAATQIRRDPLGALAEIAGHSDGEAWWNALIEQHAHANEVFAAIESAMTALRENENDEEDKHNHVREAYMRLAIRKELKLTEGDIAVVCGAWHVPALRRKTALATDRAVVKGLKAAKTEAHWVPWTEQRLAFSSGYRAGVISPGWYQHVWENLSQPSTPIQSVARWNSRISRLLRDEGLPASTASAIEATRLASTLAAIRGLPVIGLQEMQDASLAAMCHGEVVPLNVIHQRLIIGNRVGEVDESVPQPPLQLDLQRWQKKLRLKPEALAREVSLDLRSSAGSRKSALLHRLQILDIPWGSEFGTGSSRGTFREIWRLEWQPEFSIKLAEALVYGPTVERAAAVAATTFGAKESDCSKLADLVRQCLLADLPNAAEVCIQQLQEAAVSSNQVTGLMAAVLPLVDVLRYGTAREIPESILRHLVLSLTREICINLRYGCHQLDEEATLKIHDYCLNFDRAVGLLEDKPSVKLWCRALGEISDDTQVSPLLRGAAERILYDRTERTHEQSAASLSRALSPSVPVNEAGLWLVGFLKESGEILINDNDLFSLVDNWLCELEEQTYMELLPVLRRALSGFDATSRHHMLKRVRSFDSSTSQSVQLAEPGSTDSSVDKAMQNIEELLCTVLDLQDTGNNLP